MPQPTCECKWCPTCNKRIINDHTACTQCGNQTSPAKTCYNCHNFTFGGTQAIIDMHEGKPRKITYTPPTQNNKMGLYREEPISSPCDPLFAEALAEYKADLQSLILPAGLFIIEYGDPDDLG